MSRTVSTIRKLENFDWIIENAENETAMNMCWNKHPKTDIRKTFYYILVKTSKLKWEEILIFSRIKLGHKP